MNELLAITASLLLPAAVLSYRPEVTVLPIGSQAPDFRLPATDGKIYSLADFSQAEYLLVVFTCNHCPTAQAYEARLRQLHEDYRAKGLACVAISPNDPLAVRLDELGYSDLGDSFEDMKIRMKERPYPFPFCYDGETQKTSIAYGVLATPQVFLFDRTRKLRYVGRIDDQEVKPVTSHDLRNALDALVAGKPVPVEKTRVFGCSTKWAEKRADAAKALEKWNKEPVRISSLEESELSKRLKGDAKKLLLVNVWASWCGPCLSELPDLVTINRMYRGRPFEMLTITIDEPEKQEEALRVLREKKVSATNYSIGAMSKDRLAELLDKEWQGPIPYTVIIAPGGRILYRKSGSIDPLEVKRAIVGHLGRTY